MCCNALLVIAEENSPKQGDDLGSQFTEIFIKQPENVTLLLTLVEVSDNTAFGMLRDVVLHREVCSVIFMNMALPF